MQTTHTHGTYRSHGRLAGLLATAAAIGCLTMPAWGQNGGASPVDQPHLGLFGNSGLLFTPTAETLRHGAYSMGINVVDGQHRYYNGKNTVAHFVAVGLLPQVQATAVFTNVDGQVLAKFREDLGPGYGGWNFDRMFSAQAVFVKQSRRFPVSVGGGWQDMQGTGKWRSRYLVATHRLPLLGVHLGVGSGFLGSAFGGVDYQATPWLRIVAEHDGHRANLGLNLQLRRFTIAPILTGMSALGGGITYNQRL